ncbi:hypothetical protein AGMMS50268_24900 [Spirochaetia bacterium]|nr:hypothetical protein AGMMS50268_24900 [Spirochaetia bacterium]
MRKFLFALLILLVGMVGLSAGPLHPSGGSSLEIAISGYDGVVAVVPDAVLTVEAPLYAVPLDSVLLAEAVIDYAPIPAAPHDTSLAVFVNNTGPLNRTVAGRYKSFYLLC